LDAHLHGLILWWIPTLISTLISWLIWDGYIETHLDGDFKSHFHSDSYADMDGDWWADLDVDLGCHSGSIVTVYRI